MRCKIFDCHLRKHYHETIDTVCMVRRLPPDMTISELQFSNDSYVVESIVAIIVAAQYNNRQFDFYIKYGETTNNHATVKTCFLYTYVVFPKHHFDFFSYLAI